MQDTFNSHLINSLNRVEPAFDELLSPSGLNSIAFKDPYAKLCFATTLVKSMILNVTSQQQQQQPPQDKDRDKNKNNNKKIIYIDTDTQFTAYLKAGFILRQEIEDKRQEQWKNSSKVVGNTDEPGMRLIDIYLPSEGRFESMLGKVISSMPEASIVIFDSINSFYNLYPTRIPDSKQSGRQRRTPRQREMEQSEKGNQGDGQLSLIGDQLSGTEPTLNDEPQEGHTISRLNHLLSIYIMLLVKHGVYYNIPVVVTSMVRYRKVAEGLWTRSPACRRLLNQKSVVRLSVEMSNEQDLSVNVMKHPLIAQETIVFPSAGIYSSFETNQNFNRRGTASA
jgi:hypothetical protein